MSVRGAVFQLACELAGGVVGGVVAIGKVIESLTCTISDRKHLIDRYAALKRTIEPFEEEDELVEVSFFVLLRNLASATNVNVDHVRNQRYATPYPPSSISRSGQFLGLIEHGISRSYNNFVKRDPM